MITPQETLLGTPKREPPEHHRNITEYKDPGMYNSQQALNAQSTPTLNMSAGILGTRYAEHEGFRVVFRGLGFRGLGFRV